MSPSAFDPSRYRKLRVGAAATVGAAVAAGAGWFLPHTPPAAVDNIAPSAAITAPGNGSTVTGASVSFTATCSDNVACASVAFYIDGVLQGTDNSNPYSLPTFDSTSLTDGGHTLGVVSTDTSANQSALTTEPITVSNGGGGGAFTANVWVATSGSDSTGTNCFWHGVATTEPTASTTCNSFTKAVSLAPSGGGIVGADCDTFDHQTIANNAGLTGQVTIEPKTNYCATIQSSAAGSASVNFGTSSWTWIKDFVINSPQTGASASATVGLRSVHDGLLNNLIDVGMVSTTAPVNNLGVPQNFTFTGNTVGPSIPSIGAVAACTPQCGTSPEGLRMGKGTLEEASPSGVQTISAGGSLTTYTTCCTGHVNNTLDPAGGTFVYSGTTYTYTAATSSTITGVTPGGTFPDSVTLVGTPTCVAETCNLTLSNNLFQFNVRDKTLWPSSGFTLPPLAANCSNADGCHMDGIHLWGVLGATIDNNLLYGVECQGIFIEGTNNSLNSNIDIVGNGIASISSCGHGMNINMNAGSPASGTWNIGFNSGPSILEIGDGFAGTLPGTTLNFYGNHMNLDMVDVGGNNIACTTHPGGVTNVTVVSRYNAWYTGNGCGGTGDVTSATTAAWVSAAVGPAVGQDMHLTGPHGTSDNMVPCAGLIGTGCLTGTDAFGNTWPSTTANAGADQETRP